MHKGVLSFLSRAFEPLDDGRHRAEFYRLWHATFLAGFTHSKSMDTMGVRASNRTEEARLWVRDGTAQGRDLASLVQSGGSRFEDFERALITLGDETGRLEEVLRQLADFYARKHKLMLWVKKRMAYPLFTAIAACFVVPFPLLYFGYPAAYLISALTAVLLLLLSAQSIVSAVAARYGRNPQLARARMLRALATAIMAGITLPQAVRLAGAASSNREIERFVGSIDERRLGTTSMRDSLSGCPHLTPDFLAVLATAERTGDFTPLQRLADLYDDGFR